MKLGVPSFYSLEDKIFTHLSLEICLFSSVKWTLWHRSILSILVYVQACFIVTCLLDTIISMCWIKILKRMLIRHFEKSRLHKFFYPVPVLAVSWCWLHFLFIFCLFVCFSFEQNFFVPLIMPCSMFLFIYFSF